MKQFSNPQGNLLVVERGEELITKLTEYARERNLKSAWMSGLGGAGAVTLGFYHIDRQDYEWKDYQQSLEIINLTGNLSWVDGEPFWHIHGTFSGDDLQAFGGHVKSLDIALTCEVLVTPLNTPMTRRFHEETGLKLLDQADS